VALTIEDLNKDLLPKRTVRASMLLVLAFGVGQLDYENDPTLLSLSFLTIYRDQDVLAELDPLDRIRDGVCVNNEEGMSLQGFAGLLFEPAPRCDEIQVYEASLNFISD
jgi:hypothetical protein